jgi:hypothetical protein
MKLGLEGAFERDEGSKAYSKRDKGLKALSKKEVRLGNALPWMVKCLKAHLKGNEGSKVP